MAALLASASASALAPALLRHAPFWAEPEQSPPWFEPAGERDRLDQPRLQLVSPRSIEPAAHQAAVACLLLPPSPVEQRPPARGPRTRQAAAKKQLLFAPQPGWPAATGMRPRSKAGQCASHRGSSTRRRKRHAAAPARSTTRRWTRRHLAARVSIPRVSVHQCSAAREQQPSTPTNSAAPLAPRAVHWTWWYRTLSCLSGCPRTRPHNPGNTLRCLCWACGTTRRTWSFR